MEFVDLHNHALCELDDGAKSMDMTIEMLRMAERNHIHRLIVTPHYKEDVYNNTQDVILEKFAELNHRIKTEHIKVDIHPGSEIFLSKNTLDALNDGKLQTLNHTSYVLIETYPALLSSMLDLKEEIYNLLVDDYKVILAHPERYEIVHENPNLIYDLCRMGCLMQINVTSLDEKHRNFKLAKRLLDHNLIQFISTDAHDLKFRPMSLDKGYRFVKARYGEVHAEALFSKNAIKVIEDETIKLGNYQQMNKKKWFFI